MGKLLAATVLATALLGASLTIRHQNAESSTVLRRDCCGDPPSCPDPLNPACPPMTGGLTGQ